MPNPNAVLTPEQVVEQLRALVAQIGPIVPMSAAQRATLRQEAKVSQAVVEASISVIGASDTISGVVGVPAAEVRQMIDEASRWMTVEGEFRAALNGVVGANLVRRQRIAAVTGQAYNVGRQLARVPGHSDLVPHVDEVKRLRKLSTRKKRASQPTEPTPPPASATADEPPKKS